MGSYFLFLTKNLKQVQKPHTKKFLNQKCSGDYVKKSSSFSKNNLYWNDEGTFKGNAVVRSGTSPTHALTELCKYKKSMWVSATWSREDKLGLKRRIKRGSRGERGRGSGGGRRGKTLTLVEVLEHEIIIETKRRMNQSRLSRLTAKIII